MKNLICLLLVLITGFESYGQINMHSHNDYAQKSPFSLAYAEKALEIEADVFAIDGELIVAHSKKEINPANTLKKLYLDRIDSLFKLYKGKVSADRLYTFNLMIDFKTDWEPTYNILKSQIESYGNIFNPKRNRFAVRIVISGNRPPINTFHSFPDWVYFDGLPNVRYAIEDMQKVMLISDNFKTYSKWTGIGKIPAEEEEVLKTLVEDANKYHRYFRFWGAPDTPTCWEVLNNLGRVFINTDKIQECKTFLKKKKYAF